MEEINYKLKLGPTRDLCKKSFNSIGGDQGLF